MSDMSCTYHGSRDDMIVAYLYEDLDPVERRAFEAHAAGCAACRAELTELRIVRAGLAQWTPPEPARGFAFAPSLPKPRARIWRALGEIPAWAQVAAALLVLGISARLANLDVKYDRDGLVVRTGWSASAGAEAPASLSVGPPVGSGATPTPSGATTAGQAAPWRVELAALERELRTDFQTTAAGGRQRSQATTSEADLLRRVRAMLDESERKQQNELALSVARVAREAQAQRAADLQRIQYNLSVIENATGGAIVRQGKLLNNLAVRVSQQQ